MPLRGAIDQRPCFSSPSSRAKQAPESKRGKLHQSIEASRPMSAAVCRSPISA
jgi:hypothetical protein